MPSDFPTPGLKRRPRGSGHALYWVARADIARKGYTPKTVPLHYDDTPENLPLISQACNRFQAEMLAWAAGQRQDYSHFDGTVGSLCRRFEIDKESPVQGWKWNTRRTQLRIVGTIHRAFGARSLAALKLTDFRRWYDEAKKPKSAGGPERVDRAAKIMKMVREILRYGVAAELAQAECQRLLLILGATEFKQPARRRSKLELAQVQAFVTKALERGRPSLAIGTLIQFETGMRQKDVVGEWEPLPAGQERSGIVIRGRRGQEWRRWCNGLTWSDLGRDLVISKETTKTGAIVSHDLRLFPAIVALLEAVPAERRVGPLIVDEVAGRPYAEFGYAREWRAIARLAGIPDSVWNMDARAGAITEAEDAGADLDTIRGAVGHTQSSTTARYSRGAIGKSRDVATLRIAHRKGENRG
ncbi:integrase [Phreatobacter oligotrophus]|uniref:integrase n=1 Tax=Phreatobacter oligotrophus TaxID=1122261 RepID=UPI0023522F08|nr:integrase [Phreatobacter oligotrophus]MBX9990921.1 integrase [Phreatobacter oligotrophus]